MVKKKVVKKKVVKKEIVKVEKQVDKSDVTTLTLDDIKKYINPHVNDKEAFMFLKLCQSQKLNPFIKEAYLIKYSPEQRDPATMVVGKDVFTKRATRHPAFDGYKAGLILQANSQIIYREGSFHISKDEKLVGAWAEVYRKDCKIPFRDEVAWDEYVGKKKDGSIQYNWKKMPGTMIRKVALVHALREAFPDQFQGLYDSAEMGIELNSVEYSSDMPAPKIDKVKDITPVELTWNEKHKEVFESIKKVAQALGISGDQIREKYKIKEFEDMNGIQLDKLLADLNIELDKKADQ